MSESLKPYTVAKGTIASSVAGGLLTASYEATRRRDPHPNSPVHNISLRRRIPLLASSAALNSGIIGFVFFSVREYLVTPCLQSAQNHDRSTYSQRPLSWSDMRTHKLVDTACTASIVGGALNAWKRGVVGVPSGMFTATLLCTFLQFVVNEASISRVKFVSRRSTVQPNPPSNPSSTLSASDVPLNIPSSTDFDETPPPTLPQQPRMTFGQRLASLLGVKPVSDEEYLEKLKRERQMHQRRIDELERDSKDE
ncbi:hypothetical protein BD410DRAFT_785569 [Rickenella mellea]|uniref:Uncharacterized protein n=1 Tax=Rickenella mellea TaxID=50990 RepID=A0A4Y7QDB6_9AGAM|nr:hypothetical protein BD410DRAFT_785569 [Rickenella mellea]